jgi:uncharacterized Tic20 family protein
MNSTIDRADNAYKHRREEQFIAAILHMSSPWGFLALISSGVVWAASKSRSRFLTVQALQAFLFQLVSFLAFGLMFIIFMAGFYYAMFSGLIARTGVTEPELTQNLIIAAIIGFVGIFFFQFIFPLWGIWAGVQILRGKNYQYPILGQVVIRYTSRQPFTTKAESLSNNSSTSENEHILAGLGHLAMFVGFSLFLSPILWATSKKRSPFLNHNLFQASLFQIAATIVLTGSYFAVWGGGVLIGILQFFGLATPEMLQALETFLRSTYFPFGLGILFLLIAITAGVCVIIATIQAFRGREFNYPIVGKWVLRYIQ